MSNVINNKIPPITENLGQMPSMFSTNNGVADGNKMNGSSHSFQNNLKKIDFPPGPRVNNSYLSSAGAAMMSNSNRMGR